MIPRPAVFWSANIAPSKFTLKIPFGGGDHLTGVIGIVGDGEALMLAWWNSCNKSIARQWTLSGDSPSWLTRREFRRCHLAHARIANLSNSICTAFPSQTIRDQWNDLHFRRVTLGRRIHIPNCLSKRTILNSMYDSFRAFLGILHKWHQWGFVSGSN